jgi:chromosomal replication initiator protein DnaA
MLGREQSAHRSAAPAAVSVQHLDELLLQANLITQGQLTEARKTRDEMGGFIGQILVQLKYVTQDAISTCLVKHCKIPHLSLLDYDIGADMLNFVPQEICKKHGLIPIDKLGRILTVAMVDPLDKEALEAVRQVCPELRIKPILCNWAHFELVARKLFQTDESAPDSEMSMQSLGLSAAPPKKAVPQKTAPTPAEIPLAPSALDDPAGARVKEDDAQVLAKVISVSMQEALAPLREAVAMVQAPVVDQDALVATIRESVEAAMGETVARHRNDEESPPPSDSRFADVMRDMRQETMHAFRELMDSNQASQKEQQNRLAEIAEAVLQNVQEASLEKAAQRVEVMNADGAENSVSDSPWAASARLDSQSRGNLTFETFLPGENNTFPFRVSQAVAESPGDNYNPLFLCGPVGVGKTHLITAIGNAIQCARPDTRIGYLVASDFSQALSTAKKQQCVHDFRAAHSNWNVLILDDIQFLGGHVEAQEEFFHIFNVLHQARCQIIIAADKAPQQLGLMEKRLVSRFDSGIVAELKVPELVVRMDILRLQRENLDMDIPEEVLAVIAAGMSSDVRRLTGALRKVVACAKLTQSTVTCEMAADILEKMRAEEAA